MYIIFALLLGILIYYKNSIKFYIFSYFFDYLSTHENIGNFLGIRYANDYEFEAKRKDIKVYIPFLFSIIMKYIFGFDSRLDHKTFKNFSNLQFNIKNKFNLEPFFTSLISKELTLEQFEEQFSIYIFNETNKITNIFSEIEAKKFLKSITFLKNTMRSFNGNFFPVIFNLIFKLDEVLNMINVLKSISSEHKILLIVPQLSLIDKFTKYIINTNGNFENFNISSFLRSDQNSVLYLVTIYKNEMLIIKTNYDSTNSYTNKVFGIKGFQCPANQFVYQIIDQKKEFFKTLKIEISGNIKYDTNKFKRIINGQEIKLLFLNKS